MKPRKAHVKAVGDVILEHLEGQTEAEPLDVDQLAHDVIVAYRELYDQDKAYVGVARLPFGEGPPVYKALGPYTTQKQASKALAGLVAPGPQPGMGLVVEVSQGPV